MKFRTQIAEEYTTKELMAVISGWKEYVLLLPLNIISSNF